MQRKPNGRTRERSPRLNIIKKKVKGLAKSKSE